MNEFYRQGYRLEANSFGQLGPEFLGFLWALADFATRNKHPVPLPVLPILSELAHLTIVTIQLVHTKRRRSEIFVQAQLHLPPAF